MPYLKKYIIFPNGIEVEKIFSARYGSRGSKVAPKKKPTTEEMIKINRRIAAKKLRWKIKTNFTMTEDYHMVLTYKKDNRPDAEQAEKLLKNFLQNMRRAYRKNNTEFKWIIVTEYLNKAIHHHMIINGIPDTIKLVAKYWKDGHANFTPLEDESSFGDLAEYLIKETDKTFRSGRHQKQRYRCSRNLKEPIVKTEIVYANTFIKEPKPKKGYYIDKNSIIEGVNEFGYRYQYYTMIKIKDDRKQYGRNRKSEKKRE